MQAGTASGGKLEEWQTMALADSAPHYELRKQAVPAQPLGADNAELLGL
jgi:hypothetical protein